MALMPNGDVIVSDGEGGGLRLPLMDDLARTQSAAFYSGHSGQSPLVLNHIEPRYKDKVGSVPRSVQLAFARQGAKERE
jgi:hypothetical protein